MPEGFIVSRFPNYEIYRRSSEIDPDIVLYIGPIAVCKELFEAKKILRLIERATELSHSYQEASMDSPEGPDIEDNDSPPQLPL